MKFTIKAACGSDTGKIRSNNEDNFFFDGHYLNGDNTGLDSPLTFYGKMSRAHFAVFDGMGGENYGEVASFTAARALSEEKSIRPVLLHSEEKHLQTQIQRLNQKVLDVKTELRTKRMGTTIVGLYFTSHHVYVYNVGDSRAYLLRNGELTQLSKDHVFNYTIRQERKPPLTQHLGIDPEDMLIEPYITKHKLNQGDRYLLCSDGITDMIDDDEIFDIMNSAENQELCVSQLIQSALAHGGRDNITAIVCGIT